MNDEPRTNGPKMPADDAWRDELASALAPRCPWRLIHLLYLIVGVAVFLSLLITFEGFIVPLLFVMGAVILVAVGVVMTRGRSTQQDSLLWMLAIAAEHEMPLATTVAAFADQYSGRYRRRVLRVAALLDSGMSLPEALERTPRVLSRDAVLLARVGVASGRLSEALRTAATVRSARAPIWTAISTRVAYILGVLLIMQSIIGFIIYFIIPKFESIFNDFGISLPPVTIAVIKASHFLIAYFFWFPIVNLLLLLFLPFALAGRSNFEIPLFERPLIPILLMLLFAPLVLVGWLLWKIPLFDRFFKRQHTALILRSLALSIEGGRTIEGGLNTLALHYPTKWVKKKLAAAAFETSEGGDWREALMRRGLIRSTDYEVLSSAQAVGNLAWAMNELAETAERRHGLRAQALIQLLFPLVICAIGLLVLTVAVAFFAPLVELIGRLSG